MHLGDARLNSRLGMMLEAFGERVGTSLPMVFRIGLTSRPPIASFRTRKSMRTITYPAILTLLATGSSLACCVSR
ncbi:IS4/Tn5 family transposase DNA-binding protein [Vreelandella sedimenti]|uniref:IS4/Tn5 family transposase DNA-binding protein n=1 Tax=Vreelandella sedimenti TaxID=2729618 RepID=UPI003C701DE1